MSSADTPGRYLSPRQFAALRQISPAKVLAWIHSGKLRAINYAAGELGRPRYRIAPDAIAEFEGQRVAVKPKAPPKRRKQAATKQWV